MINKIIVKQINVMMLLVICVLALCSCNNNENVIIDNRIHDVSLGALDIFQKNDIIVTKYNDINDGFNLCATKEIDKRLLNNVYYVSDVESENVLVEYDLNYEENKNLLDIVAKEITTDYLENVSIIPNYTDNGFFDGSVIVDGEEINLFDYTEEGIKSDELTDDDSLDCFFTATIFGIAVWKIAVVAVAATVAYATSTNPIYVDSLSNVIDRSLNNRDNNFKKIIISGITYALTKATSKATSIAKSQKNKEYYIAIPITEYNVSNYDNCNVGDLLISNYPITKAQAVSNLKKGIDSYTYTSSKAKNVMKSAFYLYSIKKDNVSEIGYYPHYHAWLFGNKKSISGHTLHSFYGDAIR